MRIFLLSALFILFSASSQPKGMVMGWDIQCFYMPVVQEYKTWCVHACKEMILGEPQCMYAIDWLKYSRGNLPDYLDCCPKVLSDEHDCIVYGTIPDNEICSYLRSSCHTLVFGYRVRLWDFLGGASKQAQVAFMSSKVSGRNHLLLIISILRMNMDKYVITYCNPSTGRILDFETYSDIEIIY